MNWEIINNERFSLMEYRLMDQGDCKVIIKFNPRHQSARISCGNQHRLFYFESAGSLSGKTIFKNEYGMEIGNLVHDKFHPKYGSLVIKNKKYQYALQNNPAAEWGFMKTGCQIIYHALAFLPTIFRRTNWQRISTAAYLVIVAFYF
jgi:hypothetical protein